MAYQIEFSDVAKAETDDAVFYLTQFSPEAAARWFAGLETALTNLAESLAAVPGRRTLAPENDAFPDVDIFQMLYGCGRYAYRVLYYLVDTDEDGQTDTLRILHVRHGARQRLYLTEPDDTNE